MDAAPFQDFFQLLKLFLTTINRTFPECEKTSEFLVLFEFMESSDMKAEKEKVIRTWYETMKPYIKECKAQNDNVLLRADIGILEEMDIRSKWSDPEFDQDSKNVLWEYVNRLNYFACLYCEASPEKLEGLQSLAAKFQESDSFQMTEDGQITFNISAIQTLFQNEEVSQLISAFTNEDSGEMSGIKSFLECNMTDFAGLLAKKPSE